MSSEWDNDGNLLTQEAIDEDQHRRWREEAEEQTRLRELRDSEDYVRPPGMSEDEARSLFPNLDGRYDTEDSRQYASQHGVFDSWSTNKLWFVCHNCGHIGFKYGRCHQLYKCYCGSRNGVLIRASQISKVLRENPEECTSMEDVYNERQTRIRGQRAQRSARRRNE